MRTLYTKGPNHLDHLTHDPPYQIPILPIDRPPPDHNTIPDTTYPTSAIGTTHTTFHTYPNTPLPIPPYLPYPDYTFHTTIHITPSNQTHRAIGTHMPYRSTIHTLQFHT
ncbi:hypothetical protein G9A89_000574 [Geosiphon pyriformis]|nr:hypothetical protein G9A89_000574 [Geosiphon pyriformis]